jgi:hypothetical protein
MPLCLKLYNVYCAIYASMLYVVYHIDPLGPRHAVKDSQKPMVEKKIANSHCYIEIYLFMKKKRETGQLTDKSPQE